MKRDRETSHWELAILNLKERLREPLVWYPFPAIISFSLVVILSGHLLPGLNPRLGSRADILEFKAEREKEGAIWIGIYPVDDRVMIETSDRQHFSWPLKLTDKRYLEPFTKYLKARARKEAISAGLLMETNMTKTSVVLAVDQRLKFVHLRPVIAALAEARITRYGFETKMVRDQASAGSPTHQVH